ncbi:MAG: glycosyltransferase family 4 protein [Gammaproteobacteria bacterium]|nr:glycosyltransferase family 4 protein [Gammaproteobacteria bacterium]
MTRKMDAPLRIAVLTNIVPRYRTPVFSKVASDPRFQLRFFVSISLDLSDPLAREVLDLRQSRTLNIRRGTQTYSGVVQKERVPLPLGLPFDLIGFRPGVIISGDMGVRSLVALLVARLLRVPLLIWTEETLGHDVMVGGLQKRLRRFLLARADGFLAWGKSAFNYLVERGVPEARITYCAQAVNNVEWATRAAAGDPEALLKKLGTRGRVCLAVGRLLPRKGFKEMLAAFGALPSHIKKAHSLVLVGDGSEKEHLAEQARELEIDNFFMVGPKSPEELAVYYRAADFMVLPSLTDVWGLVVNEAMACAPVISSIHAGVTEELVIDTGVGEPFDPNNQQNFTAVLERWFESPPAVEAGAPQQAVGRLRFDVSVSAICGMLQSYCQ